MVGGAGLAEVIDRHRRARLKRLAAGLLAVEQAERIDVEAPPAVGAHLIDVGPEVVSQRLTVGGPARLVTDAVELQRHPLHPAPGQPGARQLDHLHVEARRSFTDRLDPEGVELPVPPRLRTLETDEERRATWLEVFLDLVFVAAIAEVALVLSNDPTAAGFGRYLALFVPIYEGSVVELKKKIEG